MKTNLGIAGGVFGVLLLIILILFVLKENGKIVYKTFDPLRNILLFCAFWCFVAFFLILFSGPASCYPECSGGTPVCDDGTCVPCDEDNMCPYDMFVCKDGTCNKCTNNKECPYYRPICNGDGECVRD